MDTSKVWGWYLLWLAECHIGFTYSAGMVTISAHFVGCCIYIVAFCDHFDYLMSKVQGQVDQIQRGKNSSEYQRQSRLIKETLAEAVTIHIKMFE